MLTALELYGFKSFPDRTRFDFPEGITVVVGPNGSGKSNIVDGIKWVLGEQSAKSLRGKEMADVIFKGTSGTGGRRPSNTAEASLFFDNSSRRLPLDSDEIRITRRVFRSGEGEYLINGEPCRLKDIRNLVRGTGVGADAYSLIEQGKVDQLLQASPRERRAIFEEAAGISRFKAKKIEAERRLGRVEQNLVRLADIVDEVGNRYRKIQSQATKASKYKQLTERLQELRTWAGAKDWRDFSKLLTEIEQQKSGLQQTVQTAGESRHALEESARQQELKLSEWSTSILELQQQVNSRIKEITEFQSNIALNQSRMDDLKVQESNQRSLLERTVARQNELASRLADSQARLADTEAAFQRTTTALEEVDQKVDSLTAGIDSARADVAERSKRRSGISDKITEIGKQVSANDSRLALNRTTEVKLSRQLQILQESLAGRTRQLQHHQQVEQQLQAEAAEKDSALQQTRSAWQQVNSQLEDARKIVAEKRRAQTGASQRAEVIQELENRLEGVESGVRELIEKSQQQSPEPWVGDVRGLVADVIKVNVQHAELVDLALGDYARCLIVDGQQLVQHLVSGQLEPSGRVRLIQLSRPPSLGTRPGTDLTHEEGVVGRMDQLVEVSSEYQSLVFHMLGGTFLVKTLADAVRMHELHASRSPARFVTLQGDVLEADGTLVAGPRAAGAGLVSRRSELRALHREIHNLDAEIREVAGSIETMRERSTSLDSQVQELLGENSEISTRLGEERAASKSLQSQIESAQGQIDQVTEELAALHAEIGTLESLMRTDEESLANNEKQISALNESIATSEHGIRQDQSELQHVSQRQTGLKVELAKLQQQMNDSRVNFEDASRQSLEGQQTILSTRSGLASLLWQWRGSRNEVGSNRIHLQESENARASVDAELKGIVSQREETETQRKETASELSAVRSRLNSAREQLHAIELRESQLTMERSQLAERLREDYDIDVAELEEAGDQQDSDREAIDKEIGDLRRAIGNIGSVNMDALLELEEMQERFEMLDTQYQDLVNAREALEKIIQKINNDSRRLFEETLIAIRSNFQQLFRQTFGGGRADLVLDEDVDILEAGIDIVATPPGKPEFNNSLLSGGERALTAVSLLMAIFQFRPSPFCVLDEVDAPFDEANVGRFIDVLRSFLDWTKFVIVTHSKVTMTAATTLYGVTMQESGVSKRVSVRFEDVSEDGEISEEAVNRDSGDEKVA